MSAYCLKGPTPDSASCKVLGCCLSFVLPTKMLDDMTTATIGKVVPVFFGFYTHFSGPMWLSHLADKKNVELRNVTLLSGRIHNKGNSLGHTEMELLASDLINQLAYHRRNTK